MGGYTAKDVSGIPLKLKMICNDCKKVFKFYIDSESEEFLFDIQCRFCKSINTIER